MLYASLKVQLGTLAALAHTSNVTVVNLIPTHTFQYIMAVLGNNMTHITVLNLRTHVSFSRCSFLPIFSSKESDKYKSKSSVFNTAVLYSC